MMNEHEINAITSLVDNGVYEKHLYQQPQYLQLRGVAAGQEKQIREALEKIKEAVESNKLINLFNGFTEEMFELLTYSTDTAFFLGMKMGYALSGAEKAFGEINEVLAEMLEKTSKGEC